MGKNLVEIIITAEDKASKAFGDVKESARGLASGIGGAVKAGALVAGGAIAGIGAAAAAGAAAAVNSFLPFEKQMAEVFTLLPGISQSAMSDMQGQVLDFSREFGTLPNEVVPSLYQALSAGVPPNNVFDFLKTAQMAATGGVTDLTTAVDGISSVVNAYGEEMVSAGQASDQMFTAVRLGKTTFEELSASLFNVTPTAAGLGVSFGDVTAALASLTAQGVPTSVATTQIRQLLIELSKEGSKAAGIFEEMSGQTFKDFIASGGNLSGALFSMQLAAEENGVAIQDMFGSVEAGSAALALSSDLEGFSDNIAAMGDSAGATEAAFTTMSDTGAFKIDQLKATFQTGLLAIGGALAPVIDAVIAFANEHLTALVDKMTPVTEALGDFFTLISEGVHPLDAMYQALEGVIPDGLFDLLYTIGVSIQSFVASIQRGEGFVTALTIALAGMFPPELASKVYDIGFALSDFVSWISSIIVEHGPLLAQILGTVALAFGAFTIISTVVGWISGLVTAVGGIITAFTSAGTIIGGIVAVLGGPLTLIIAAVAGAIALLTAAWTNNWGDIQGKVAAAWAAIQPHLQAIWDWLSVNVPAALEVLRAAWVDVIWPAIQTAMSAAWDVIKPILEAIGTFIVDTLIPKIQELYDKWVTDVWPTIQTVTENVWTIIETIFTEIGRWINDNIIPWVQALHDKWVTEVWPAIQTAIETVWGVIEPIWQAIKDWLEVTLPPILDKFKTKWEGIMSALETAIAPLKSAWDTLVTAVQNFWNWLSGITFSFNFSIPDLPEWATPGSPLPIHTAWKNFSGDMERIGRSIGAGFGHILGWVEALGVAIGDGLLASLNEVEDRASALFDLGGKIGQMASSFAGFFQSRTLAPMQEEIDALTRSLSDIADNIFGRGWGAFFAGDDIAAQRFELLARLNDPALNVGERDQLRWMLSMLEEREQLQAEYLRQKEREAQLAELTAQGDFLKQQMDLIRLVTDNGLSASLLQGLNLGIGADPGRILEALTAAYAEMVASMAAQVAADGGNGPGGGANADPNSRAGFRGGTVINIDARRAERGAAQDIRSAVEMVLRDYGIRGDIRVRTT